MSQFGKAVADAFRQVKQDFNERQGILQPDGNLPDIDRQVREQVNGDIDKLIDKHEGTKSFPPIL